MTAACPVSSALVDDDRTPLLWPTKATTPSQDVTAILSERENTAHDDAGCRSIDYSSDEPLVAASSVTGVLALLMIGVFVANAEGSLVLASYASISSEFGDLDHSNWIVTSYMLATSVMLPMYGKLSDIFGRADMIMAAYTMFAVGNLICGIAQSLPAVVAGRIVAGFGGAGMGTLVSIIITDLVPRRDVAMWRSYVGIFAVAGRASGGFIGGILADTVGWRWTFLGQCPPTILALLLSWRLLPNRVAAVSDHSKVERLQRVDFIGCFLISITILTFLLPLELANTELPWNRPGIYYCLATSVAIGVLTVQYESCWAREPILSPRLLFSRDILVPNTVNFCQAAAQLGMMYTVPVYFQAIQSSSNAVAGAHLLPAPLGVTVGGLVGGYATKRFGHYKLLLVGATTCSSISYLLLVIFWGKRISTWESLYIFPSGLGNGLVLSTVFVSLTAKVEKDDLAAACSIYYMTGQIGALVGIAITDAVLQNFLWYGLVRELDAYPDKDMILQGVTSSIEYIQGLEGPVKDIVVSVYTQAIRSAHVQNLIFGVIAWLASLFIREYEI